MDYTQIKEYYINGSNPPLENELLVIWAKFCFKSNPLPIFESIKTVSQKFAAAHQYFVSNFTNNLCFFIENEAFVIFGDGQDWLDNPVPELADKRIAVLVMAASLNGDSQSSWQKISCLKECFRRLKNYGYDTIGWNLNRQYKRRAFSRMIQTLNAKKNKDCYYVEL